MMEELAKKIHARFREQIKNNADKNPESDKPWDELSPDLKASNRAAAARIVGILAAVGLECVPGKPSKEETRKAGEVLEQHLEMLAEMEHDGWMDEKRKQGWTYGATRDNANLKHPLMIPYGDLPEIEKNKDRDSIRQYPRTLEKEGYKIVPKRPRRSAPK